MTQTLNPHFVAKVTALYTAGHSIENCGFECGVGTRTIKRALTQSKTPLRTQGESVRANKAVRGVCRQTSAKVDYA